MGRRSHYLVVNVPSKMWSVVYHLFESFASSLSNTLLLGSEYSLNQHYDFNLNDIINLKIHDLRFCYLSYIYSIFLLVTILNILSLFVFPVLSIFISYYIAFLTQDIIIQSEEISYSNTLHTVLLVSNTLFSVLHFISVLLFVLYGRTNVLFWIAFFIGITCLVNIVLVIRIFCDKKINKSVLQIVSKRGVLSVSIPYESATSAVSKIWNARTDLVKMGIDDNSESNSY